MNDAVAVKPINSLDRLLREWGKGDVIRSSVAEAVTAIASAAVDLQSLIARGDLALGSLGRAADTADDRSDRTRPDQTLDAAAEELVIGALDKAPVAWIGLDHQDAPEKRDESAPIAVAIDPLDGLANVASNIPLGTIFSILPASDGGIDPLLQTGDRQLAAGFVIYGPQTCLVLTLGRGTDVYTLDRQQNAFIRTQASVSLPADSSEYSIEASNYRHWDAPIQAYVDDNVAGDERPGGKDFNMRWIGSLVAEAYRILIRGGIYLYPGDRRPGFEKGRLRLIHEANPIAMIVEQAGGLAIDGEDRILTIRPQAFDQRVPLIFGSKSRVERVRAFHDGTLPLGERSPLFGRRGLFRH